MLSLALFLAAFGSLPTRYGFPSGNSSTAPIDAPATVTPVSCEDALFPPPHRAGLWTMDLWTLSTPNAEETQSPVSLGVVDSRCGHVSPFVDAPPQNATPDDRCRLGGMPRWQARHRDDPEPTRSRRSYWRRNGRHVGRRDGGRRRRT